VALKGPGRGKRAEKRVIINKQRKVRQQNALQEESLYNLRGGRGGIKRKLSASKKKRERGKTRFLGGNASRKTPLLEEREGKRASVRERGPIIYNFEGVKRGDVSMGGKQPRLTGEKKTMVMRGPGGQKKRLSLLL